MKTQTELISYYQKNMVKVIKHHGVDSDYVNYAFYLLQAVKIGIIQTKIYDWATNKCEELHKESLNLI